MSSVHHHGTAKPGGVSGGGRWTKQEAGLTILGSTNTTVRIFLYFCFALGDYTRWYDVALSISFHTKFHNDR